ncbi:hypothetical protein, partial [Xanthomonas cucurbitae]|uniref:hypothetical protein n=1 Tax=Xanthomonas cucurbitae TaxID=56453 RepID=UPI001B8048F5
TFWDGGKGLFPRLNADSGASRHPHESAMSQKSKENGNKEKGRSPKIQEDAQFNGLAKLNLMD